MIIGIVESVNRFRAKIALNEEIIDAEKGAFQVVECVNSKKVGVGDVVELSMTQKKYDEQKRIIKFFPIFWVLIGILAAGLIKDNAVSFSALFLFSFFGFLTTVMINEMLKEKSKPVYSIVEIKEKFVPEVKLEETIIEEPAIEEVKIEEAKVEEPAIEEEKIEEEKVEEAAIEEEKVEEAKVEEPAIEEVKVEEPAIEEEKVEEEKVEEPAIEEVKVEEPAIEEEKVEEAKVEELAIEEEKIEEEKVEEAKVEN